MKIFFLNGNEESLIAIKEQIKKINPNININSGKIHTTKHK